MCTQQSAVPGNNQSQKTANFSTVISPVAKQPLVHLRQPRSILCRCLGADQIRQPGPLRVPRMPGRERQPSAYPWAKNRQSRRQLCAAENGSGLWGRRKSDTTECMRAHTHTSGESRGLFPEEQINTSWHPLHRWGNQDRETEFLAALGTVIPDSSAHPHHRGSPQLSSQCWLVAKQEAYKTGERNQCDDWRRILKIFGVRC